MALRCFSGVPRCRPDRGGSCFYTISYLIFVLPFTTPPRVKSPTTMALPIDNKNDASLADADSRIRGNLSPEIKQRLETVVYDVMGKPHVFGSSIMKRIVVTEASMVPKAEEPSRSEVRVVCEVAVTDGSSSSYCSFVTSLLVLSSLSRLLLACSREQPTDPDELRTQQNHFRYAQRYGKAARRLRRLPDRRVRHSTPAIPQALTKHVFFSQLLYARVYCRLARSRGVNNIGFCLSRAGKPVRK